jgi:outer membrane biosynthesis protein TonB
VPDRRSIFRLLALAGFLLTVALALWLAELRPLLVVVVMAIALLLAWVIGWLSWRQDSLRPGVEDREVKEEEAVVSGPPPPVLAPSASQEPPAAPIAEDPSPPAEPEPVATPAPKPQPTPRPPLRPVPTPPPHPVEPPAPQPARPAARASGVIDMRTRVTAQPRRWNLWDLERRARNEAQRDPVRYEEWSFLFVHLRQFATPDGSLPTEFDELVRESFGELLEHAG